MRLVLISTAGFALWIILWALGAKSFDAFMLTMVIVLIGAALTLATPFAPGKRDD